MLLRMIHHPYFYNQQMNRFNVKPYLYHPSIIHKIESIIQSNVTLYTLERHGNQLLCGTL